jgi:hypothetical protein
MKIHPLSFNLPDYNHHAAVIGKLPASALPPGVSNVLSFWHESIETYDTLKQSCIYTDRLPVKQANDSLGDYMPRYFDSLVKQPQRQQTRTVIGIKDIEKTDPEVLADLLAEARNFNATVLLSIPAVNKLPPDLVMAIFAIVGLFVIGQLTPEDKTFLQAPKYQYFEEHTDSITNLNNDQYCIVNRKSDRTPTIYHGVHAVQT